MLNKSITLPTYYSFFGQSPSKKYLARSKRSGVKREGSPRFEISNLFLKEIIKLKNFPI